MYSHLVHFIDDAFGGDARCPRISFKYIAVLISQGVICVLKSLCFRTTTTQSKVCILGIDKRPM